MHKLITIKEKRTFQSVFNKNIKIHSKLFNFFYQIDDKPFSIGFIIQKKVGKAVLRNLIKRRLKSIFRNSLTHNNLCGTLVIVCKKSNKEWNYSLVDQSCSLFFDRYKEIINN